MEMADSARVYGVNFYTGIKVNNSKFQKDSFELWVLGLFRI